MKNKKSILIPLLLVLTLSIHGQTQSYKRGLAFETSSYADLLSLSSGVSWYYNWGIQPNIHVANNFEETGVMYVPMTWNGGYDSDGLKEFLKKHPTIKYLLAFNEPNFLEQANMTPKQTAAAWPELEAIADEFNLKLISPATNWCGHCVSEDGTTYNDPIQYMDDFFEACPDCRVDFIGIHFYMPGVDALKANIERLRKYGKPLWLTEFNMDKSIGDNGTADEQRNFMVEVLDYLEQEPLVYRYSWFIGRSGIQVIDILTSKQGELTDLGKIYVNMSSYDNDYYHKIDSRINAAHYIRMKGISLVTSTDVTGEISVGYIDDNDRIEYNLDVAEDGEYVLQIRTTGERDGLIRLSSADKHIKDISIPGTGGWSNWHTIAEPISLTKGKQTIKMEIISGGFDINWFSLVPANPAGLVDAVDCLNYISYSPVNNLLNITCPHEIKNLNITNVVGENVLQTNSRQIAIDHLLSGLYFVKLTTASNSVICSKFLKL